MHSEVIDAIRRKEMDLRNAVDLLAFSGVNLDYDDTVAIMTLTILYLYRVFSEKQALLKNGKHPAEDGPSTSDALPVPSYAWTQLIKAEDPPLPLRRPKLSRDAKYPLAARRQRKRKRSAENSGIVDTNDVRGQQQRSSNADGDELMAPSPRKRRRPIVVEPSTRVLRARKTFEALDAKVWGEFNASADAATPSQD